MPERPIIFSAHSVKAIIEGRKTQTRRVINPQFRQTWGSGVRNQDPDYYSVHVDIREPNSEWRWLRCPYGKRGDRVWVKEAWRVRGSHTDGCTPIEIAINQAHFSIAYQADITWNDDMYGRVRSPLHMPRAFSRLTLEIVSIRAERLQDISEEDAIAEGLWQPGQIVSSDMKGLYSVEDYSPRTQFMYTWEAINFHRGYGWNSNPWVWAITFKEVKENNNG